nr:hypothetical protein Iba_chr10dCG13500 [Ipomoea batatas]
MLAASLESIADDRASATDYIEILRRRLLLTLRLAIKLKRTQRPTLKSDNPEVIIMLDLPMIPIDLEVADQIRGNLELTLALRLSLGARVSTLCDHESPPIDLEAAIPIKGSRNANTRTKAKVITFFSPGLSPAKPTDTCELRVDLGVDQVGNSGWLGMSSKIYLRDLGSTKSYLMKWRSCRLAILGLAGDDLVT